MSFLFFLMCPFKWLILLHGSWILGKIFYNDLYSFSYQAFLAAALFKMFDNMGKEDA